MKFTLECERLQQSLAVGMFTWPCDQWEQMQIPPTMCTDISGKDYTTD